MEALAASQIAKRKAAEERAALEQQIAERARQQSGAAIKEQQRINEMLGFPDPPAQVFAIGKDCAAGVWWVKDNLDGIIGWEVCRYRRDKTHVTQRPKSESSNSNMMSAISKSKLQEQQAKSINTITSPSLKLESLPPDDWLLVGSTRFDTLPRLQVLISNLSNEQQYKFTVKAINSKGCSIESCASNSVVVDSPLPPGWHRFYDENSSRFYYASLKSNRSSWNRPEHDPFFLEDDIYNKFSQSELDYIKGLYLEDMEHYQCITIDQFVDIMRECGENCSKNRAKRLFRAFGGNSNETLTNWKSFMDAVHHIKKSRENAVAPAPSSFKDIIALILIYSWVVPIKYAASSFFSWISRLRVSTMLSKSRDKLGNWIVEYSSFAERNFYRNLVTGATSWSMPDEVRFYLPKRLEKKLLDLFDFGQVEEFKQYFAQLDVDSSGDLSDKEMRIMLKAMGVEVDDKKFAKLIHSIDANGNGTIEFDEFCYMMYDICRKDKARVEAQKRRKDQLQATGDDDSVLQIGLTFTGLTGAVQKLRQQSLPVPSSESAFASPVKSLSSRLFKSPSKIGPELESKQSTRDEDQSVLKSSRKSYKSSSKISAGSPVKGSSSRKSKYNKFEEDDEDIDESERVDMVGYSSKNIFSLGSQSKSQKDKHPPFCMCGCRKF